jgi:hypothetical protein
VIADVVNCVIAGIGVIHAAVRLFVRKTVTADQNTVMTQNWTRGGIDVGSRIVALRPKLPEYIVQKAFVTVAQFRNRNRANLPPTSRKRDLRADAGQLATLSGDSTVARATG